jgi:lathosterol oxidase
MPLVVPINIDLMFFEYGVFFYSYGCYLHWGYELDWPDAHHPVMNTAFQHYCHHARASMGRPYHCGFFLKCWDQLFGSMYDGECFCVKCQRARGQRTRAQFELVQVPDYTQLTRPGFWLRWNVSATAHRGTLSHGSSMRWGAGRAH